MVKADIITSIVFILLSIYVYISSLKFPKTEIQLTGPAFYPQIISILLIITSIAIIIRGVKKLKAEGDTLMQKIQNWKRVLMVMVATFIYVIVLRTLGFLITTFLYLTILILLMQPEKSKIKVSILISAAMTGVIYLIFSVLFSASLPRGILL